MNNRNQQNYCCYNFDKNVQHMSGAVNFCNWNTFNAKGPNSWILHGALVGKIYFISLPVNQYVFKVVPMWLKITL